MDKSQEIGVYMIDAFTNRVLQYMEKIGPESGATLVCFIAFSLAHE